MARQQRAAPGAVERLLQPLTTFRRLFQQSLQLRAVMISAGLLLLAFIFVGSFISHQIANSLFRANLSQALEESSAGFSNVQTLINSSDATGQTEIQRDVVRFLTVLETSSTQSNRQWVLLKDVNAPTEGFIEEQSQSGSLTNTDIPAELAQSISEGAGIYWQSSSMVGADGRTAPVLVVGTDLTIPQNPDYTLYLVYDLSSSQTTVNYINLVVWVGFGVLLVVVLTIVWAISRLVIRPISSTAITAEKLAAGDLDQRVLVRGHNETARLGMSFNRMADSLQDQISRLEKLSTMQQRFVSDVSHELRTPLTTVRMAADMLHDNRENMEPLYKRSTELLYEQVDRFDSLLADLLEISRFDAGSQTLDIVSGNLMSVLEEVLKAVEPHLVRTGTPLTVHTNHTEIMVDMDHRRIERVLRNLLFNAVEHSEGKPIDVYLDVTDTAVGVAVRDHGIGLSPEETEQVFNRFWRADTSRKRTLGGTGLGLSIAAEDVRLHQGTLEAWGIKGQGACFRMTLPVDQDVPMGPSPVLMSGEPVPPSGLRTDSLPTSREEPTDV
ncbi:MULTISPECIES: MtrAB system histidine kinase MtrB [Rothia]|uniref:Sensor histidine kinase MtrB n=1 Tax=Rothia nasimurium TaxID=85336 RepID=A0A1Y1RMU7_9MICC|nr:MULTISPECIES: MtrAB system histidine kinase MtrB [Rothia]ORC15280.1 two-component sensor histidine kinase [Rothia nasimurium]